MKKSRTISILLAISILFSLVMPAFATTDHPFDLADEVPVTNDAFTRTEQIGDATYYLEQTDSYILSIGVNGTSADCAIRYLDTNETYAEVISNGYDTFTSHAQENVSAQIETIRYSILSHELVLPKVEQDYSFSMQQMTRVTDGDRDKVISYIQSLGYPKAQLSTLWESKIVNGKLVMLYLSYSYQVRDRDLISIAAGTALSVLRVWIPLPDSKLRALVALAVTAKGVWEVVTATTVKQYETYHYGRKYVRIDGQNYCTPGRTVYWLVYVGDGGGVAENLQSDRAGQYYYDNDKLFETAYNNYISMSS